MSDTNNYERYTCPKCGYSNFWTHDEIRQRAQEEIYRGNNDVIYSLPCKNECGARMRVTLKIQGA